MTDVSIEIVALFTQLVVVRRSVTVHTSGSSTAESTDHRLRCATDIYLPRRIGLMLTTDCDASRCVSHVRGGYKVRVTTIREPTFRVISGTQLMRRPLEHPEFYPIETSSEHSGLVE